jgi:paraquat-inducible protein A
VSRVEGTAAAATGECVACRHCDLLHVAHVLASGEDARCRRCATPLPLPGSPGGAQAALALAAAALVAFGVSLAAPLMHMSELGRANSTTLPESAAAMWLAGSPATAVVIVACAIAAPAAYLALLLFVGAGASRSPVPRAIGVAARWACIVKPWAMPEVMLLATLVAFVKIAQLSQASPGVGMYATAAAAGLMALAHNLLDLPGAWSRIEAREGAK